MALLCGRFSQKIRISLTISIIIFFSIKAKSQIFVLNLI